MEEHWVLIPKGQIECKEAMIPADARFFLGATVAGDKIAVEIRAYDPDGGIIFEAVQEPHHIFPMQVQITLPCDLKRLAAEFSADQMDLIYGRRLAEQAELIISGGICQLTIGDYFSWEWIDNDGGEEETEENYADTLDYPVAVDDVLLGWESDGLDESDLLWRMVRIESPSSILCGGERDQE